MKKSILCLTLTLLLLCGMVQVAAAAGTGCGGGPHRPGSGEWVSPVEVLNLTDQQLTKMRAVNQNSYEQIRELRIKLMDSRHELVQLRLQKQPDQSAVDAKIKEINDVREKLHTISQQGRQECQSLLTKEQQAKLQELPGKKGSSFRGCPGTGKEQ